MPAGRIVSNFCRWMTLAALAIRLAGQPLPAHLRVIRAPLGAFTVRRWIFAPPTVRTPLTRTSGNGLIIRGRRLSVALNTAPEVGTAVGAGWATGSTVGVGGAASGARPGVPAVPPTLPTTVATGVGVLVAGGGV